MITATEFEIGDRKFRSRPMSAFDQMSVAGKLGGVLMLLMDLRAASEAAGAEDDKPKDGEAPKPARKPPTETEFIRSFVALSGDMKKTDTDLVLGLCLAGVEMAQPGDLGWARVQAAPGILLPDISDLDLILRIVWRVLEQHRIQDFFYVPPSSQSPT